MKQLLIVSNTTLNGGAAKPSDLSGMAKGAIGFFHLDDYKTWLSTAATKNFGIVLGYGTKANAFVIPEVDFSSLTVQKATGSANVTFQGKITVPTPTAGSEYTVIVVKKGVTFHERNTWTATTMAKAGSTATTVAEDLVKQIKASSETSGVTASNAAGVITITAAEGDYNIVGADELTAVKPVITSAEKNAIDQDYIQDLASRCAAGKGFNYTAEDAHEMYPGYPETVAAGNYTLYTLRFKVGRSGAKQRDEQVYQLVHIAVLSSAEALIGSLDTILGIGIKPTPSVEDGD